MSDTKILLPTASAGKDNAYYLDKCVCVEHRPAYAACMAKIEQRKEGRLESIFSTCSTAITRGDCVAVGMREKELLEGKAIYFVSRQEMSEAIAARDQSQPFAPSAFAAPPLRVGTRGMGKGQKTRPAPDLSPAQSFVMPSYADAITAAVREESRAERKQLAPQPSQVLSTGLITMMPGESIRDYAARVLAANKEKESQ